MKYKCFEIWVPECGEDYPGICDEEWLLSERYSTDDFLLFQGYDANMFPMPDWKDFDENNFLHQRRKKACLQYVKGFKGKVQMDSIVIKEAEVQSE